MHGSASDAMPHWQNDCHLDQGDRTSTRTDRSILRTSLTGILADQGMVRPTPVHFRVAAGAQPN